MKLNGNMLKDARDRKGMTQDELAQGVGISVPTVVRAEKGEEIWPTTGRELCQFLGVDLEKAVIPRVGNGDAA